MEFCNSEKQEELILSDEDDGRRVLMVSLYIWQNAGIWAKC